jgi:hypothetical protein
MNLPVISIVAVAERSVPRCGRRVVDLRLAFLAILDFEPSKLALKVRPVSERLSRSARPLISASRHLHHLRRLTADELIDVIGPSLHGDAKLGQEGMPLIDSDHTLERPGFVRE